MNQGLGPDFLPAVAENLTPMPIGAKVPEMLLRIFQSSSQQLSVEDRAIGAYLGLAVGDALGATTEFMTPREIRETYGVHRKIRGGGWLRDWPRSPMLARLSSCSPTRLSQLVPRLPSCSGTRLTWD